MKPKNIDQANNMAALQLLESLKEEAAKSEDRAFSHEGKKQELLFKQWDLIEAHVKRHAAQELERMLIEQDFSL